MAEPATEQPATEVVSSEAVAVEVAPEQAVEAVTPAEETKR